MQTSLLLCWNIKLQHITSPAAPPVLHPWRTLQVRGVFYYWLQVIQLIFARWTRKSPALDWKRQLTRHPLIRNYPEHPNNSTVICLKNTQWHNNSQPLATLMYFHKYSITRISPLIHKHAQFSCIFMCQHRQIYICNLYPYHNNSRQTIWIKQWISQKATRSKTSYFSISLTAKLLNSATNVFIRIII